MGRSVQPRPVGVNGDPEPAAIVANEIKKAPGGFPGPVLDTRDQKDG
jgi:hypothetical protein